ncbi:MAG TPA: hypothetical protein VFV99_10205 [Kofleriaceae bacterium]|nr:hypothetical protein [Kofleriaceae bacterium]
MFDRGRHDVTFGQRIRSERLFGNAMAAGACAGAVAIANLVAPGLAWAAVAAFPVLVAAREFVDQNRTIARWWRGARATLPTTSGEVIVRGIARALDANAVAPYSRRECLGYWAQFTGTHFGDEGGVREDRYVAEDHVQLADVLVEVGDAKILVPADRARLICDPRSGEGARLRVAPNHGAEVDVFVPMTKELLGRARHQEHVLRAGDEVVVVGRLEAIGGDPYRDAIGATHRVAGERKAALVLRPPELAPDARYDAPTLAERPRVEARPYTRPR